MSSVDANNGDHGGERNSAINGVGTENDKDDNDYDESSGSDSFGDGVMAFDEFDLDMMSRSQNIPPSSSSSSSSSSSNLPVAGLKRPRSGSNEEVIGFKDGSNPSAHSSVNNGGSMDPSKVEAVERLMIVPSFGRASGLGQPCAVKLVSLPRISPSLVSTTGRFWIGDDDGSICEINRCCSEPSSWFVGDRVIEDGSLFVATPVDPLFILLPFLERVSRTAENGLGRFMEMDQLLDASLFPSLQYFPKKLRDSLDLSLICEEKRAPGSDSVYFRLREDKVLNWLKGKVLQIRDWLQTSPFASFESMLANESRSSTFNRTSEEVKTVADGSKNSSTIDLMACTESAIAFLSEYVEEKYLEQLKAFFGVSNKKNESLFRPITVASMLGDGTNNNSDTNSFQYTRKESASTVKSTPPASTSKVSKSLEKASKGLMKLDSFFTKKT